MERPRSDRDDPLRIPRRSFLEACVALALASAGCASLGPRVRSAYAFANDPAFGQYRDILRGLIGALLPFEEPAFTLSLDAVETNLLELFRLETDRRFLTLQQTLTFFDDLDLFAYPLAFTEQERLARDVDARQQDASALLAASRDRDRQLYAEFTRARPDAARRFTRLSPNDQRAYFQLWGQSGFLVKRQFHLAAKSVVMIAAYSLEAAWTMIGYEGPLMPRVPRR